MGFPNVGGLELAQELTAHGSGVHDRCNTLMFSDDSNTLDTRSTVSVGGDSLLLLGCVPSHRPFHKADFGEKSQRVAREAAEVAAKSTAPVCRNPWWATLRHTARFSAA